MFKKSSKDRPRFCGSCGMELKEVWNSTQGMPASDYDIYTGVPALPAVPPKKYMALECPKYPGHYGEGHDWWTWFDRDQIWTG